MVKQNFSKNNQDNYFNAFFDEITDKKIKLAIIGLGYVGIPLAISFAKKLDVLGFDINSKKIELYKKGIDLTAEIGDFELKQTTVEFTSDEKRLQEARFLIVAVPTPVNSDKTPDLKSIIEASKMIGRNLVKGSIIVYESTVYPGVTEDICIPILEKESGLRCGRDFKVGYSPERINPGDKVNRLQNIKKIVSAIDQITLEIITDVYSLIIEAGVYQATTIKVAEAAKISENAQRDINIAFMNELAMIFDRMGINTKDVLEAMNTKWNALGFQPGLVGGHCISVDPYYFIYQAEKIGFSSQLMSLSRKINDAMGSFVADEVIKYLIKGNKVVKNAKVYIMGVTFKENCPDIRNSKVEDIIKKLNEYEIQPILVDPIANKNEVNDVFGQVISNLGEVSDADCIIFAVAHDCFKYLTDKRLDSMFKNIPNNEKIIIDVKNIFNYKQLKSKGYLYWSL